MIHPLPLSTHPVPLLRMESEHPHKPAAPAALACACAAILTLPCVTAVAAQFAQHSADITDWTTAIPDPWLLTSSVLWAIGIGALAALLAWPAAWVVARRGLRPSMLTPMLVPSYLAYHSLGLLRDPTTWLGNLIEHAATAPPDGPGLFFVPVLVGRVLAFVGLGLWAWPLAALVLGSALRTAEPELTDNLEMDGAGAMRRHLMFALRVRGAWARAAGLVALVMLGSAVPLHLSAAPTLAVAAWQEVTLHPGSPSVWLTTWPLLVIALAGAWVLSGSVLRAESESEARPDPTRTTLWATRALVCASTVLPLVLYALFLRTWHSIPAFLRVSGDAAATSAETSSLAGIAGALVCGVFWWACASGRRTGAPALRTALCAAVFASLVPGVLVGHAWAAFWTLVHAPDALMDSALPTVLAHTSRSAGVAALAGCALAALEPRDTRDARAIDAGPSLLAWARTGLSWPTLAGVAVGVASLSLHEIESSIVVQPPGLLSLPQTMLANLHFARQEETSAGAIIVIGAGLLVTWAVGLLLARRNTTRYHPPRCARSSIG